MVSAKAEADQNLDVRAGLREHLWEHSVTHGYSFHNTLVTHESLDLTVVCQQCL